MPFDWSDDVEVHMRLSNWNCRLNKLRNTNYNANCNKICFVHSSISKCNECSEKEMLLDAWHVPRCHIVLTCPSIKLIPSVYAAAATAIIKKNKTISMQRMQITGRFIFTTNLSKIPRFIDISTAIGDAV